MRFASRGTAVRSSGDGRRVDCVHVVAPANTSLKAASSRPSASSSSAFVIINGGSSRITFPAVRLTSTPCRVAASCTAIGDVFGVVVQLEAPHQSRTANLDNRRMLLLQILRASPAGASRRPDVIHQARLERVKADERGPACEQVSAKRASVIAEREGRGHVFADERRAHRHTSGQRLADGHEVRTQCRAAESKTAGRSAPGRTAPRRR